MAIAKRKKRFFDVEIPSIKKETQLQAYEIVELEGRTITYDLTRLLRGKNLLGSFKVSVKEGKATASPTKIKLLPSFLKRMVRKGTNYVEDSLTISCEDGSLEIKPFLITRRKVARSVRNALRIKCREELTNYCKDKTALIIFENVLKNSLQKELSLKLKKIYPLSLCEIRALRIKK